MYFTPRGKDLRAQKMIEFSAAQKLLDLAVSNKKIEDFFIRYRLRHIAIAPYNHFAQCLAKMTGGTDIVIECFCDRMYQKYRTGVCNIPVYGYEMLREMRFDAVVVASGYYLNEITDSLIAQGIPLEKIIGMNTVLYAMGRF